MKKVALSTFSKQIFINTIFFYHASSRYSSSMHICAHDFSFFFGRTVVDVTGCFLGESVASTSTSNAANIPRGTRVVTGSISRGISLTRVTFVDAAFAPGQYFGKWPIVLHFAQTLLLIFGQQIRPLASRRLCRSYTCQDSPVFLQCVQRVPSHSVFLLFMERDILEIRLLEIGFGYRLKLDAKVFQFFRQNPQKDVLHNFTVK